jgi:hypothetical protein
MSAAMRWALVAGEQLGNASTAERYRIRLHLATEHIAADYPVHDVVERLLHASGQWVVVAAIDRGEPIGKCSNSSNVSLGLHHDDTTGGAVHGPV